MAPIRAYREHKALERDLAQSALQGLSVTASCVLGLSDKVYEFELESKGASQNNLDSFYLRLGIRL